MSSSAQRGIALAASSAVHRGLLLDGVDEYVGFGSGLNFGNGSVRSFAVWFRTTASAVVFCNREATSASPGCLVLVDSAGTIRFQLFANATTNNYIDARGTGAGSFLDGHWHFLVVSYSGNGAYNGVTAYVDGTSLTISDLNVTGLSSASTTTAGADIGRRWNGSAYVFSACRLANLGMYGKVLDSTDRAALYGGGTLTDYLAVGPTTDLLWYPKLTVADSPTQVFDRSSGARHGTPVNVEAADFEVIDLSA